MLSDILMGRRELTYRAAVQNIAAIPIFLVHGSCSLAILTAGSMAMVISETKLSVALEIISAVESMHLPLTNGLHIASRGQQAKIDAIISAK